MISTFTNSPIDIVENVIDNEDVNAFRNVYFFYLSFLHPIANSCMIFVPQYVLRMSLKFRQIRAEMLL